MITKKSVVQKHRKMKDTSSPTENSTTDMAESSYSQDAYQAIVDAIPDMIIRLDRNGIFRSFEGAGAELYWPAETYLGKSLQAVLPSETAALFQRKLEATFTSGEIQSLEYTLLFDGEPRHYESRMVRSTADEVIVIVRNVTRKRRIDELIRRYHEQLKLEMQARTDDLSLAESKYQRIFHHSGSPSIIIERDVIISMANPKFVDLTGYRREEIEGRMKWTDFIDPSDQKMVETYHHARRVKEDNAPSEYECKIIDREGRVRDIFIKVGMLPDKERSIASLIDITSLKQTERELRDRDTLYSAILEGYDGLIYTIDKGYRIRFMNENLIKRMDHDATGQICYQAIHQRESKCTWCAAEKVFEGQSVRFEIKNPHDHRWYYSVNVPVRLSDDSVYCQAMITDINKRKEMEEALRDSEAHLREENIRLRGTLDDHHKFGDIVGKSAAMLEVFELMLMAASAETNMIIYGESGTGKELVARAIHDISARQDGPFVPVNCGAIPENLLESEFFGHKKGAFTGADRDKTGFLCEADGGSLFLDEIGEIRPELQVKLLRAIEGGGYTPVGSNETRESGFRIIAATNRNLHDLIKKGAMRSDFFYRIHVIPIHLPPLRERKEDIPLLIEHFLKAYDRKMRPPVTPAVIETLTDYDWPGNVRELQNVMYRFVTLKRLDLVGDTASIPLETNDIPGDIPKTSLPNAVAAFEERHIRAALAEHRWNRTRTAKSLKIGLRTLQRKMNNYGIK